MGYLADITKQLKKGQDVIFVGTGIIVLNDLDEVLMCTRTDNNQWSLPGGSLEVGETLEQCIIRETEEETGIILKEEDLHLNYASALTEPIEKNGKLIHVVSVTYWVNKYDASKIKISEREFTRYEWFSLDDIFMIQEMTPYSRVALDKFIENRKKAIIKN